MMSTSEYLDFNCEVEDHHITEGTYGVPARLFVVLEF